METSLKSSVEEKGEIVKKCLQFAGGNKKTFKGVITRTIQQSEFTRFDLEDGRRVFINPRNVDWFEVVKDKGRSRDEMEGLVNA